MARISSKTSVGCDAGAIIHLDELGCLHLMNDFEKVVVPDVVRKEVLTHRAVAFEDADVTWIEVSHQFPVEEPLRSICGIFSLDAGEVAALAVLSKEPGLIY